jgi:predicted metal-dependent phosphoesterase TrpH
VTTPRRNAVDLHCHTSRSDGLLTPRALYEGMRQYGMRLVAISDHDTLDGYRELRDAGLGQHASIDGPQVIPAVEINSVVDGPLDFWETEPHVLGYGVDPDDRSFEGVLRRQREYRSVRFWEGVDRLREIGMPVDDVVARVVADAGASLGRPLLGQALVLAGWAASVDDAFRRIVGRSGPGYVPKKGMGPREAIEAIRSAGGIAVLAHFAGASERPDVLDLLQGWGLGGLEIYYGGPGHGFPADRITAMAALAERRGLLPTGGSDYHGHPMDDGRPFTYADAQATTFVPDEVGKRLLEAIRSTPARLR